MPYIPQANRDALDGAIQALSKKIRTTDPGTLNYAVTRLLHLWLEAAGVRYCHLNAAIGVLECAKLELYRRILAPYEDTKVGANGDIGVLERWEAK